MSVADMAEWQRRYQRVKNPVSFHSDVVEWRGLVWGQCGEKGLSASLSKPAFKKPPHTPHPRVVPSPYVRNDANHELSYCLSSHRRHPRRGRARRTSSRPVFSVSQLYNVHRCRCERKDKQSKCPGILGELKWSLRSLEEAAESRSPRGEAMEDATILQTEVVPKGLWIKEEPPQMESGTRLEGMRTRCRQTALQCTPRRWRPNYTSSFKGHCVQKRKRFVRVGTR